MSQTVTVHVILNAHLDPVWLWPWTAGVDSAIATCRSACDLLDRHPELVFNRGEAWVYDIVERLEPALFARIRAHVSAGRWHLVGGWWIQPDCNLPSGFAMERQIRLGQDYFLDRFGIFPTEAYNVDSFGHAAALPTLLRRHGQHRYVFMRPQEHEKTLPARLFSWSETPDSPAVTAFRIPSAYRTVKHHDAFLRQHVAASLEHLTDGVPHTMSFMGVGDHGGGPTETLIEWIQANRDTIAGARLEISTPARFFAAAESCITEDNPLPRVTGELQHHAVGCYCAYRRVKSDLRRAEHLTRQAEAATSFNKVEAAWRDVCFHQFHDTLGGTCTESAYTAVHDQLGRACATAEELIHFEMRRQTQALPDDPRQRLVWFNASDHAFDDWVEVEPWLEFQRWQPSWRLVDRAGAAVPHQVMDTESRGLPLTRLLLPLELGPNQLGELMLEEDPADNPLAPAPTSPFEVTASMMSESTQGLACEALPCDHGHQIQFARGGLNLRLESFDDPTDTWSHGIDRYPDTPIARVSWGSPRWVDDGPLMASMIQSGTIEGCRCESEWRLYHNAGFVEWRLRVDWTAQLRVLKLTLRGSEEQARFDDRIDGVMGAGPLPTGLARPMNGVEVPIQDFTRWQVQSHDDAAPVQMGVVCPDVYALDADLQRIRFTLLRSPWFADHEDKDRQTPPIRPRATDRGLHTFKFRFYGNDAVSDAPLAATATMLQRPPAFADITRGMKHWPREMLQ